MVFTSSYSNAVWNGRESFSRLGYVIVVLHHSQWIVINLDGAGPTVKGPPVGPENIEGVIPVSELIATRRDQTVDNAAHHFLDEPYYSSRTYELGDIDVPVLSVANLGGILLHLRGNVIGYEQAGTKNKWLWFISGR